MFILRLLAWSLQLYILLIGTSVLKELIVVNDRFNTAVAPTEVTWKCQQYGSGRVSTFPAPVIYLLTIQWQAVGIKVMFNNMPFEQSVTAGLWTNQSDQLNHVTAAANQYLPSSHVTDWERACLELQISDRDEP